MQILRCFILILFAPLFLYASQIVSMEIEEAMEGFEVVLKVKVIDYRIDNSGIIIHGRVKKVLLGNYVGKKITTSHHLYRSAKLLIRYDSDGNEMRASPIVTGSGNEAEIKIGKTYLFSYYEIDNNVNIQRHERMDHISEIKKIRNILNKKRRTAE